MNCKRYHIMFSTFFVKFKCKICVQKQVIHDFKNHILVMWPDTNLFILRKCAGLKNQITIILFKIWPSNRFPKAKSYNFHFHKNDVTWPLSANGPFKLAWKVFPSCSLCWFVGTHLSFQSKTRLFPMLE